MRAVVGLALLLTWTASPRAEAGPGPAAPPVPAGTLVIHGGGTISRAVMREFVTLASKRGTLVVIPTASSRTIDAGAIVATWQARGFAAVEVVHTTARAQANDPAFVEPLTRATAAWIDGGLQAKLESVYGGTLVERELHALLARGGVIAGTSAGAAIMSRVMIRYGNPTPRMGTGFGLIAGAVIDQHFAARARKPRLASVLRRHPELFGLGVDEGTAVVVRGDRASVIGDSTVTLGFSPARGKPARFVNFAAGDQIDLGALRAEAAARSPARHRRRG